VVGIVRTYRNAERFAQIGAVLVSAILAAVLLACATARARDLAIVTFVLAIAIVAIHLWRDRP